MATKTTGLRADPCLNPACRALNVRQADQPPASRCPRCGSETLTARLRDKKAVR